MRCAHCSFENAPAIKFCGNCGLALKLRCERCGFENQSGIKFCGECGGRLNEISTAPPPGPRSYTPPHLAERILAEQAAMEARGAQEGERKTITALFADIKGSVELMADLDPEEARRIVDPALQLMMDAVHRYEGYVAQSRGDGILALFGAPLAHEDHPRRALHAAMRMQENIKRYADELRRDKGVTLEIRVGINTGEVVVRSIRKDDLHTDYVPIGHSTNIAARLESLATPGSILVSPETRKLTEGYFEFQSLGAARVKGVSEAVELHQVMGLGPLRTKLEVSAKRGLVRFVGRETEMAELGKALELTKGGRGQIVGVVGEAGVGKSRLCHEFKLRSQKDIRVLEAFAVSHGKTSPYLPVIELLRSYFTITPGDDETRRREKITGKLSTLDRSLEDVLPHLFSLLGILEPTSALAQMDPQIRRQRTFDALKRVMLGESQGGPLLVLIEDLHWIDGETEAFLATLAESLAAAKLMLLLNYRPEYAPPWGRKGYVKELRLDPLEKESAEEMLTAMLGEAPELKAVSMLILAKSEGTPFFMEEIVQGLFERGILERNGKVTITKPVSEVQIPTTVEGVLSARIDRLAPEAKGVIQTAAVIGREFSVGILERVMSEPSIRLRALLADLQAAEFVYEQPASEDLAYVFKHALTREVAYGSVLMERRRELHERTARAIEGLFANRLEERYGDLAHHYSRSGNAEKAVDYLTLAAAQAIDRSAVRDAVASLTAALELVGSLPRSTDTQRRELLVLTTLGPAFMATHGYGSAEVAATYSRANELSQQSGDSRQLFWIRRGLWASSFSRAEHRRALAMAEQLLALAKTLDDSCLLVDAHRVDGLSLFHLGDFSGARTHLEAAVSFYEPEMHRVLIALGGEDSGVSGLSFLSCTLWLLGYPEQASERSGRALALARHVVHPHGLAFALAFAAKTRCLRREPEIARERAESTIALAAEHGFPQWSAYGEILRGWALAEQIGGEESFEQLRSGLDSWRAIGARIALPFVIGLLADALRKSGRPEEAGAALDEAFEVAEQSEEPWWNAELHRVRGELFLASPAKAAGDTAEQSFWRAIELARHQSAKSLELRGVTSLSRLLRSQGKCDEARRMLAEIYGWFTEGFDTADLKDARALLDSLES
jgi:class 3 adenylate cyclase/predicted ATPase